MENGGQNGVHTGHDRDPRLNGVNGLVADGVQNAPGAVETVAPAGQHPGQVMNGGEVGSSELEGAGQQVVQSDGVKAQAASRMNDLPDEIIHITQGFVPLSLLLTRLAQTTHNSLQEKIAELAKMPVPAGAVNGNSAHSGTASDDSSSENIRKKASLLHFAQDMHAKWIKALVIAEWSRKASKVSKLIDLKFLIDQQRMLYDAAVDSIATVKRDLAFARMPSPDLKTALQVLSTGSAPWMPDLQYIEPPPLSPSEQLKWMNDLNTLLSLRLNLEDFDKIPQQFRNYDIGSGRVTFKVAKEFEVDLTIADEDFEKQFWFIDFRFAFKPAASTLPEGLRLYLEACVNDALSTDGLVGCYRFLHEFVLTYKINELKRQAIQLSRGAWTGTLTVEPLNRALAVQYWTSRGLSGSPKSWVLVAIDSGRKSGDQAGSKSSSSLVAKWYRDNKEVKDVNITLDVGELSAESLLTTVVALHVEAILTSIHDKMATAPRFKNRDAGLALQISREDPAASSLATQVGYNGEAALLMEPKTGLFAIKPHSRFSMQYEHQLNNGKNPTEDGVTCLENVRCGFIEDELNRRGSSMGWYTKKSPLNGEELRSVTKLRDWSRTLWLQKDGWSPSWYIAVFLGLGGDEWWLLEANHDDTHRTLKFQAKLPLNKGHPEPTDTFWTNLTVFATGMIAQSVDMRELHRHRIKSRPNEGMSWSLPQQVRLPSIEIALSAIFPAMVFESAERGLEKTSPAGLADDSTDLASIVRPTTSAALPAKQPWANDMVTIKFKGVQSQFEASDAETANTAPHRLTCISDAVIKVRKPSKFATLKGLVDRDVSYNAGKGEFCLRMQHEVGKPVLPILKSRVKAVDRFVNFLESTDKAKGTITSESVTLREVTCSYSEPAAQEGGKTPRKWRLVLDLSKDDIAVKLEKANPHLRVVDLMQRLVNSDGGIGALMVWLPASLPALKAVDKIETRWEAIQAKGIGRVEFSMKTIDWMTIRYTITGPSKSGQSVEKHLTLEVRIKVRRGEPWWHAWRSDPAVDEEFSAALRPIWQGKGDGWHGLTTSAAGRPSGGVAGMLLAVDDAVRGVVGAASEGGAKAKGKGTTRPEGVVVLD